MKKYTFTDKEWENVLNKVQTLEKENQRLTGVIEGMEKAFSLYGVSVTLICDVEKGTKCKDPFPKYDTGVCRNCFGQSN